MLLFHYKQYLSRETTFLIEACFSLQSVSVKKEWGMKSVAHCGAVRFMFQTYKQEQQNKSCREKMINKFVKKSNDSCMNDAMFRMFNI
jgi:hypothetical protein